MMMARGRLKSIVMALVLTALFPATCAFAGSYVIIVNNSVPISTISKDDLRAIFLGEKVKWDNRKYVRIVMLEEGKIQTEFLRNVLGKTPSQFDNHWQKLVFTGKASMPTAYGEMSKVVDYVAKQPGAIGFVAVGQAGDTVKTISVK